MAEPTAPRPQDIPDDLIRAVTEGLMGLEVRRVIANVWPEIERRVREQVAAEIEAERSGGTEHWVMAMDHAARIARGESR